MSQSFEKLARELDQVQRALAKLDGDLTRVKFDPNQPSSIQAAITRMEVEVDGRVSSYRSNPFVADLVEQVKENLAEKIRERAAAARSELIIQESTSGMDGTIFRQIENTVNDLKWSEYNTFDRHIKKLSRLLHAADLEPITRDLLSRVDLDAWIAAGEATQGGMIGSATLEWPADPKEELGMTIALIDAFARNEDHAVNFSHQFYYTGSKVTGDLQNMTAQVIVPFARDYIDYIKQQTGAAEATLLPQPKSQPAARKAFVVHGHDEGAREAVARFLEQIGIEPVILHEQANQGRTVIEKIEAHGEVGFAVVLLTPDDTGSVRDGELQPRARQNVLLELGYFIGRLGRSRVCALKRGELEIPSDFGGVVYESFDAGNGWKGALGRELQAAGFEIDWNRIYGR